MLYEVSKHKVELDVEIVVTLEPKQLSRIYDLDASKPFSMGIGKLKSRIHIIDTTHWMPTSDVWRNTYECRFRSLCSKLG
ncbi:MAG: hypothetical protein QXM12_01885 [Nitrososphaerota archaeon]